MEKFYLHTEFYGKSACVFYAELRYKSRVHLLFSIRVSYCVSPDWLFKNGLLVCLFKDSHTEFIVVQLVVKLVKTRLTLKWPQEKFTCIAHLSMLILATEFAITMIPCGLERRKKQVDKKHSILIVWSISNDMMHMDVQRGKKQKQTIAPSEPIFYKQASNYSRKAFLFDP